MKAIFKMVTLCALLIGATACSKSSDDPTVELPIEASYMNVAGNWSLTNWNNEPLAEGVYCYLVLNRSKRTFEVYDNMNSMYDNMLTGSYTLTKDKKDENVTLISGEYAFGLGAWNHVYELEVYENRMIWSVQGDSTDVSIYERLESISEEVLARGATRTIAVEALNKLF